MTDNEEEETGAQPVFPNRGPNKEGMTSDYLPESDDWVAKTILDIGDPAAVAALSQIGTMYPEVDTLQTFVDETVEEFLKAQTSVGGLSRDEYKSMIEAMHGKNNDSSSGTNVILEAMGADDDD